MQERTHAIADSLLRRLGIDRRRRAYDYLMIILEQTTAARGRSLNYCRTLYPLAAMSYGVTGGSAARRIRHTVERAWNDPQNFAMRGLFNSFGISWPPNNNEFIAVLTECIRLSLDERIEHPA